MSNKSRYNIAVRDATEKEREEFRRRFGVVGLLGIFFGFLLCSSTFVIALVFRKSQVVAWFAFTTWGVFSIIWLVFRYRYLRCPFCNSVLWSVPGVCRKCGTRLELFRPP